MAFPPCERRSDEANQYVQEGGGAERGVRAKFLNEALGDWRGKLGKVGSGEAGECGGILGSLLRGRGVERGSEVAVGSGHGARPVLRGRQLHFAQRNQLGKQADGVGAFAAESVRSREW